MILRLALVLGVVVAVLVPSWFIARYTAQLQRNTSGIEEWALGIAITLLSYCVLALASVIVFGLVQIVYWIITGDSLPRIGEDA